MDRHYIENVSRHPLRHRFYRVENGEMVPFRIHFRNDGPSMVEPHPNTTEVLRGEFRFLEMSMQTIPIINQRAQMEEFYLPQGDAKREMYERVCFILRGILNWAAGRLHQFTPNERQRYRQAVRFFEGDEPEVVELRQRYERIFLQDRCIELNIFIGVTDAITWFTNPNTATVRRALRECLRPDDSGFQLPTDLTIFPDVIPFNPMVEAVLNPPNLPATHYRISCHGLCCVILSKPFECYVWYQLPEPDPNVVVNGVH